MKLSRLSFVKIGKNGEPISPLGPLSDIVKDVRLKTTRLYEPAGPYPPWMGNLGLKNGPTVGRGAFSFAPRGMAKSKSRINFSEFEGPWTATEMARHLIQIVTDMEPAAKIFAYILCEKNDSNRILQKQGFVFSSETCDEDGLVVRGGFNADGRVS